MAMLIFQIAYLLKPPRLNKPLEYRQLREYGEVAMYGPVHILPPCSLLLDVDSAFLITLHRFALKYMEDEGMSEQQISI